MRLIPVQAKPDEKYVLGMICVFDVSFPSVLLLARSNVLSRLDDADAGITPLLARQPIASSRIIFAKKSSAPVLLLPQSSKLKETTLTTISHLADR